MQTDPNWSNFQYSHATQQLQLIDFGATRALGDAFCSQYLELVWAAANRDREGLLRASKDLGFLDGTESPAMVEAHVQAGYIAGEPFAEDAPFDFAVQAGGCVLDS